MRKTILIPFILIAVLFVCCQNSYAVNIGKPEPTTENLVFGYAYDSEIKWTSSSSALPDLKMEQHQAYAQLNFVHNPFLATYVRLGGVEMTTDRVFNLPDDEVKNFSPGTALAASIGLQALLVKYEHFSLGGFAQYTMCEDYDERINFAENDEAVSTLSASFALKNISWYKAGVGVQTNIGKVNIYGGVFYFDLSADATATARVFNLENEATTSYENNTSNGAFFGIRIPVDENFMVCLEAQQLDTLSGGISVNIKLD